MVACFEKQEESCETGQNFFSKQTWPHQEGNNIYFVVHKIMDLAAAALILVVQDCHAGLGSNSDFATYSGEVSSEKCHVKMWRVLSEYH